MDYRFAKSEVMDLVIYYFSELAVSCISGKDVLFFVIKNGRCNIIMSSVELDLQSAASLYAF